ncbi:peptidylprolyl isomerase [Arcobacter sp. F2176]|uniref:peptidylprolyl isomerase n=1 Tax=Arcobacter sp. F2176 TaxID=2044511 RepID=UPI00100ADA82|nr:peptidylprolyl isomerase [Arcobacter sp. F2176]RXJ81977.1 peptidylprolyl isomerase [Arcobacter sp. F2176]
MAVEASARHILIDNEEICNQVKEQIISGDLDFVEAAEQYSLCPSGDQGGALGTFGKGQMVKEFEDVVFTAPVGEIQGPVQTEFGYHLIEVTSRNE